MDGAGMIEPAQFVLRKNVTSADSVANIVINEARNLPHLDFKRVAVCASGPSLADHIEDIRARQKAGWSVAAMNGAYNFLQDHGIVADLFFMVDARPGKNLSFVSRPHPNTAFYIASQCQPEIFDALEGRANVQLWPMFHDEAGWKAIQETRRDRGACFVGALNVGQSCLVPLWALGFKVWHLFGYDGSMRGDDKHAFPQAANDGEEVQEFYWPISEDGKHIEGMTKRYLATPTMAHGAQAFPDRVSYFRKLGIDIQVIGEGLIPDMVARLASHEGAVTASDLSAHIAHVPPAKPRQKPVERLQIVSWKWKGHIPYTAEDVNIWASQVDRWLDRPAELVCITDDPEGIDGAIRTIPLWRDNFEHGRDWHRLRIFSEEMADIIGPRFVSLDLDTVICGDLDPLFANDAPFMAYQDPFRDQYCTAMFMMDAGAFPHVWQDFDPQAAIRLRQLGVFGGYDQAWISHVLPGQPRWTASDGVLSFRVDVLRNHPLHPAALPDGARVINFHGKHNPRDADVQAVCPWIADYWQRSPIVSAQDQDERRKYQKIWTFDNYRVHSPGENAVSAFLEAAKPERGAKVIDLGCGTGRASVRLSEHGLDVSAVDFAENAFEAGGQIPFTVANLWNLPETVRGDWGYCCDVMEHIPPERVRQVLASISSRMSKGAFFSISLVPDKSGAAIGEVLHLTVRPLEWWQSCLEEFFARVECVQDNGRDALFLCASAIAA